MFEHILVPLDGSTRAEQALPVAARIARAVGGSVELLQVVNVIVDGTKLPLFIVCPVAGEMGMPQEEYTQTTVEPSKEEVVQVE